MGMGMRDEMDGHSLRQQLRQAWRGRQVRESSRGRQFIKAHNHHHYLLPPPTSQTVLGGEEVCFTPYHNWMIDIWHISSRRIERGQK